MASRPISDIVKSEILRASEDLKIEPHNIGLQNFKQWCLDRGTPYSESLAAEKVRQGGGFARVRDALFPKPVDSVATEREGLRLAANKNRKEHSFRSREEIFWEKLETTLGRVFDRKIITPVGFATKKPESGRGIKRELNVLISDTHFGSDLDARYVPLKYGTIEEARRLAYVVKQVCEYKRQYRKETRLRVHLAGDIIQNQLHDKRDGDISAAQVARAIWLLDQALAYFAAEFPEVIVDVATGNHGRNTGRHQERATLDKVDSLETMIYYALKVSAKNLKNVTVNIPRTPYLTYESFGAKCFGTHGDTVLNAGYPGKSVKVSGLEAQINRINASLPNADEYKLFFMGHVHVGMMLHMSNGATIITNGALIPTDQYGVSIGLFETQSGQWMWESVPGHVVGDSRFITIDSKVDSDTSLDRIVRPFDDF
jgi:hypothetical protein